MNIRTIIIEELTDFNWMNQIEPKTDLKIGQLWLRYDGINSYNAPFFNKLLENQFGDIMIKGDKVYMIVDGYCELYPLFKDNDSSRYGYINRSLAEQILCENDYWEPYDDTVWDFGNQVWDIFVEEPKLYKHLKEYIIDNGYLGEETEDGEEFIEEFLDMPNVMGNLIENDDLFVDVKREMIWAHNSAYNTAARDEIWESTFGAIKDIFGEGYWESYTVQKLGGVATRHRLYFDITHMFHDFINEALDSCFDSCRDYFDPSKYEGMYGTEKDQFESEDEAFEDFCEECWEFDGYHFSDYYMEYQENYGDLLNPSFNEHPDDQKVREYFIEDFYNRV